MKAMVLAAGRGSRLAPLTDSCPKPLVEVGGMSLLERVISGLEQAGFTQVVVNVSWLADQVVDALRQRESAAEVLISDERAGRLETGGGVYNALPLLGARPFALVNADVLSDFPAARLAQMIQSWSGQQAAHLVLVPNPPHNTGGDFGLAEGLLTTEPAYTFAGVSVLSAALFDAAPAEPAFPLAPLLRTAAARQQVTAELYRGYWNDVGTHERLRAARAWVRSHP